MEILKEYISNISGYAIANFLLLALQTSLWHDFMGSLPAPHFILYSIIIFALYQPSKLGFINTLISAFIICNFTIVPIEINLIQCVFLYILVNKLKERIYWHGFTYYWTLTAISVFVFHITYYLLSWSLEESGWAEIQWLFFLGQILISTLFAPLFYLIYNKFEKISFRSSYSSLEEVL